MEANRCKSPPPNSSSFLLLSNPLNPSADSAPSPASVDADPPTAMRISFTRTSVIAALIAWPNPYEWAPSGSNSSRVVIPHSVAISITAISEATSNHEDSCSIPVAP